MNEEQNLQKEDGPALGRSVAQDMQAKQYIRPKKEILREYNIGIRFLSVGCIINVGCREIPFTSINEAMNELTDYVNDPQKSIDKWNKVFNEN